MSRQIAINAGGIFEQVEIEQSDDVFWVNNDTQPHWPVPWCYGLRVEPNKTSNTFQVFPGASPNLPQQITYQDALSGQTGVILVYNDFQLVAPPYETTEAQPSTQLTQGGKSPYDTSATTGKPQWITFAESTPGSCAGFNAVIAPNSPKGPVTFNLNATDALGKNIQQKITINIT